LPRNINTIYIKVMDPLQEESVHDFLENATEPFTLEEITAYVQMPERKRDNMLAIEIAALIDSRKIAFRVNERKWLSRRGFFEPAAFVIKPTKLELVNGILIPGHRCVPFANPLLMPHEYSFFCNGSIVPVTSTEGPPEDLYPFYCVFGEEYAPQYIARENPENESAFNADPYEDPPEVSIRTLDMRNIYRELAFVPGDRFVTRTLDWKKGHFELKKAGKDEWTQKDLYSWHEAAEEGFEDSFALLGPGSSTEEQITYAYWYAGKRIKEIPAYSLEEFLYEKTDRVETVPYGIETRFWYAGKEIPDNKSLQDIFVSFDRTLVEEMLHKKNIPISEYVIHAYLRDALFRNEKDIEKAIYRVFPPIVKPTRAEIERLIDFMDDNLQTIAESYSLFLDQGMGPIRKRVAELHTAVVELAAKLQKGETETSWLPRHTFIILSQIQGHAASLLEDLAFDDPPPQPELEAMDNSLDSMIETFSDVKELIENAMNNFRRNNFTLIRGGKNKTAAETWRVIQFSISGTDVWRRALVPEVCTMAELHQLIQAGMGWKNIYDYRFFQESPNNGEKRHFHETTLLGETFSQARLEFLYEYGTKWTVKIIVMSSHPPQKDNAMCFIAGANAAPPETVDGPLRFRRLLNLLEGGSSAEKKTARQELGADFSPGLFNMKKCNKSLK